MIQLWGVGSLYWHVKKLAAEHVGGADTAADDSGTGTVNACIRALGAAKTNSMMPSPFAA